MQFIIKNLKLEIIKYSILTFLLAIIMVAEAYLMQFIVDATQVQDVWGYIQIIGWILVFLAVQTALYYAQQYLTAKLSKESIYLYRLRLFEHLSGLPLYEVVQDKREKVLATLTSQLDLLEHRYFYTIYWGGYLICQLIVAIIVSLWFNPLIALLAILLSLPNLLVALKFKQQLEQNQMGLMNELGQAVGTIKDVVDGISDWQTFNCQPFVYQVFERQTQKLLTQQLKVEKFQHFIGSLNQLFSNLLYFGSWFIGGIFIIQGQLSLGGMIAFSQLLVRISYPVYTSSDLIAQYVSGRAMLEQLEQEFLMTTCGESLERLDIVEFSEFAPLISNQTQHVVWQRGKKYLVLGESGSGKSTLLKALIQETAQYRGEVGVNGKKVQKVAPNSLYNQIAYVPQAPHLFAASLRENLTVFNPDYSDAQLYEVLTWVELEKWANREALDLVLQTGNLSVSGGEMKRIALARALLSNKEWLLIDEFSSGIDKDTLAKIETKLLALDKTLVYVTHVQATDLAPYFDEIYQL